MKGIIVFCWICVLTVLGGSVYSLVEAQTDASKLLSGAAILYSLLLVWGTVIMTKKEWR